ncbi:MAG: carboxypeptidase-like regulatory domain-containing protein, partial [Methanobacterium sp.]
MNRFIIITISLIMAFLLCGTAAEAGQHNNEAVNSDLSAITNSDQVSNSNSMILTNSGSKELSSQSNIHQNDLKNILISGIVRNCLSGELFPGVVITVKSIIGDELAKTNTDSTGSYQLNFLSNESIFDVTASNPGHISSSKEVTVTSNPQNTENSNLYGNADFRLGPPSADIKVDKWVCNGTSCSWVKTTNTYNLYDTAHFLVRITNNG